MAEKTWHEAFDEWARQPKEPCPNCGLSNMDAVAGRFDDQTDKVQVVCLECGVSGPLDDLETMAWVLWDAMPRTANQEVDRV